MPAGGVDGLPVGERDGADGLGPLLELFVELLERQPDGELVEGHQRESVLRTYADLEAIMPRAFGVDDDEEQEESVVLYKLLRAITDVDHRTIDSLFTAGLTSVEIFAYATPGDLHQATGVPEALCERIWRRVQAHREERQTRARTEAVPRIPCPECAYPMEVPREGREPVVRCLRCRTLVRLRFTKAGSIEGVQEIEDEETPYQILGVEPTATDAEVKKAYRERIAAYHPDKVAALGPELREVAEQKTRQINLAYESVRRSRPSL